MHDDTHAATIRRLNDRFRQSLIFGGQTVLTQGVGALSPDDRGQLLSLVRQFNAFTEDNDPHHEHDFGSFEIEGETYFFKIDYYALDMDGGSEDPADPEKTTRVLTIMRADEY